MVRATSRRTKLCLVMYLLGSLPMVLGKFRNPHNGQYVNRISQIARDDLTHISYQPFDYNYRWKNDSNDVYIRDSDLTFLNSYTGGSYQEASSAVSDTSKF